jgi:hypothetical protein
MIEHGGKLLPSITWGIPALILGLIVCLLAIAGAARLNRGDRGGFWIMSFIPIAAILALIIVPLFALWPYQGDYHRFQPVRGTVAKVETRSFDSVYVITYQEGAVVRCDDSRCANIHAGDRLSLLCTKEHQFGSPLGADGWGCRWDEQR